MLDLLSKRFHSRSFHDTENPKVVWKIVLNEQYLLMSIRIVFVVNPTVTCTKLLVSITTSNFNQNQRSLSFNHSYHQCGKYYIFFHVSLELCNFNRNKKYPMSVMKTILTYLT